MAINLKNNPRFGGTDPRLLERDQQISSAPTSPHIGHDFISDKNQFGKIEEKVAQLSLQINQVIVKPYLQQALDYLKNSKLDATNAYNQLSDQIASEVKIISQNSNVISDKLKQTQAVIAKTQDAIRNKYNNATEDEISSCELNLDYEYNIIAEHYELSLQLTQELSKYKSRIDTLLSSQNLLDESMVPAVSRIQLEIDNLELLLHGFDSSDYANILAKKQGKNVVPKIKSSTSIDPRGPALNNMIEHSQMNNYQSLNSIPRVESMNRYEDPMLNNNINLKRYDVKNYNLDSPQGRQDQDTYRQSREIYQNINTNVSDRDNKDVVQPYGYNDVPMSRKELKMQNKLRRQELEMQRMMSMQKKYSDNLRQMESMRADMIAKEEQTNRLAGMKDFSNVSYIPNEDRSAQRVGSKHASQVYEAEIPLETINENLAKSPRDKIFVVRTAEPITSAEANKLMNDKNSKKRKVKTIKVIK